MSSYEGLEPVKMFVIKIKRPVFLIGLNSDRLFSLLFWEPICHLRLYHNISKK